MKTISKKQFENAVKKVLSGGKSSLIVTEKVCPFHWTRSKGYCNLHGKIPANSKYLGNIGRGGQESEQYLVCYLAPGYVISETKAEEADRKKAEKTAQELKKAEAQEKYNVKKQAEISEAQTYGLTVKELRAKKAELKQINENLLSEFEAKRTSVIRDFDFQMFRVVDRVKLSRILAERNISYSPKNLADFL